MFPNNFAITQELVRTRQEEIERELRAQRHNAALPASSAQARLGRLIGLLVAAAWLISFLI